jgi:hypothetical protein
LWSIIIFNTPEGSKVIFISEPGTVQSVNDDLFQPYMPPELPLPEIKVCEPKEDKEPQPTFNEEDVVVKFPVRAKKEAPPKTEKGKDRNPFK